MTIRFFYTNLSPDYRTIHRDIFSLLEMSDIRSFVVEVRDRTPLAEMEIYIPFNESLFGEFPNYAQISDKLYFITCEPATDGTIRVMFNLDWIHTCVDWGLLNVTGMLSRGHYNLKNGVDRSTPITPVLSGLNTATPINSTVSQNIRFYVRMSYLSPEGAFEKKEKMLGGWTIPFSVDENANMRVFLSNLFSNLGNIDVEWDATNCKVTGITNVYAVPDSLTPNTAPLYVACKGRDGVEFGRLYQPAGTGLTHVFSISPDLFSEFRIGNATKNKTILPSDSWVLVRVNTDPLYDLSIYVTVNGEIIDFTQACDVGAWFTPDADIDGLASLSRVATFISGASGSTARALSNDMGGALSTALSSAIEVGRPLISHATDNANLTAWNNLYWGESPNATPQWIAGLGVAQYKYTNEDKIRAFVNEYGCDGLSFFSGELVGSDSERNWQYYKFENIAEINPSWDNDKLPIQAEEALINVLERGVKIYAL